MSQSTNSDASELLVSRHKLSRSFSKWFQESGKIIRFPAGLRSVFVGATIQIALEHHASIIDLMEMRRIASALTLLRPLFEESTRSSWLLRVANEEQLTLFGNGRLKPGAEKMVREVGKRHQHNTMLDEMKPVIDRMHGFTHGGMDQLQYRFGGDKLLAAYPDRLLADALMVANLYAAMAFLEGPAIAPDIPLGDRLHAEARRLFGFSSTEESTGDNVT